MAKRDRSGLPHVDNIHLLTPAWNDPDPRPIIEVQLSNGYVTRYDLTRLNEGDGERFAYFVQQCGLMQIRDTDEIVGRLYHGDLVGWWWLVK